MFSRQTGRHWMKTQGGEKTSGLSNGSPEAKDREAEKKRRKGRAM